MSLIECHLSNVKDPFESKYQLHINGREKVGIKKLKNSKAFNPYAFTACFVPHFLAHLVSNTIFLLVDLKYSAESMTTKFFTSSSIKIFK